jgi:uncharacterized protein YbjT (DUF2867 family)
MNLVTGATGRVGTALVRQLRAAGQEVRALVRKGSEYYWLNDTGCRFQFGDLRDPESLSRALQGVTTLYVASGPRLETRDNHHGNVTEAGHRALFGLARARGLRRVVLLSCLGASRVPGVRAFEARLQAEHDLAEGGPPFTILRSSLHEHQALDLLERAEAGWGPSGGERPLNPIAIADIAAIAIAAGSGSSWENRVLEVGGAEALTGAELLRRAAAAAGRPAPGGLSPRLAQVLSRLGRPVRRYAHRLAEDRAWLHEDLAVDGLIGARVKGGPLSSFDQALQDAVAERAAMADPEERERRMVHPQFYATVYQPGVARLGDLPSGPPPRRT